MLNVLYQDEDLIAVAKPSGLLVHPTSLARDSVTCLSLLRSQCGISLFPVHRLDRGTSGVLLFALSSDVARSICRQFANSMIRKTYLTVVRGWPVADQFIDYPLRDEERPSKTSPATTSYSRLQTTELPIPVGNYPTARYALLNVQPLTGRKHQIRRHMAHIRHPVIGDTVHGDGRHNRLFREHLDSNRLLLHAKCLTVAHPATHELIHITAPLPMDMSALFKRLNWQAD